MKFKDLSKKTLDNVIDAYLHIINFSFWNKSDPKVKKALLDYILDQDINTYLKLQIFGNPQLSASFIPDFSATTPSNDQGSGRGDSYWGLVTALYVVCNANLLSNDDMLETVDELIKNGAESNKGYKGDCYNNKPRTPIMICCMNGISHRVIDKLIDAGAVISGPPPGPHDSYSENTLTPLDYFLKRNAPDSADSSKKYNEYFFKQLKHWEDVDPVLQSLIYGVYTQTFPASTAFKQDILDSLPKDFPTVLGDTIMGYYASAPICQFTTGRYAPGFTNAFWLDQVSPVGRKIDIKRKEDASKRAKAKENADKIDRITFLLESTAERQSKPSEEQTTNHGSAGAPSPTLILNELVSPGLMQQQTDFLMATLKIQWDKLALQMEEGQKQLEKDRQALEKEKLALSSKADWFTKYLQEENAKQALNSMEAVKQHKASLNMEMGRWVKELSDKADRERAAMTKTVNGLHEALKTATAKSEETIKAKDAVIAALELQLGRLNKVNKTIEAFNKSNNAANTAQGPAPKAKDSANALATLQQLDREIDMYNRGTVYAATAVNSVKAGSDTNNAANAPAAKPVGFSAAGAAVSNARGSASVLRSAAKPKPKAQTQGSGSGSGSASAKRPQSAAAALNRTGRGAGSK